MTNQTVIKEDIKVFKQDVNVLKQDVNVLKEDVSILKQDVNVLKEDVSILKQDVNVLKEDQKEMRNENEVRHHEIMRRFGRIEADQTYTWKKAVENEREINMLKSKRSEERRVGKECR